MPQVPNRFEEWLSLQLSRNYARTLVLAVEAVLATGELTLDHFDDEKKLCKVVYDIFRTNTSAYNILPGVDPDKPVPMQAQSGAAVVVDRQALGTNTMYRLLLAIQWYAKYLGHSNYSSLENLMSTVSWRSRNHFESEILLAQLVPYTTITKFNAVSRLLQRRREETIDPYIRHHFRWRGKCPHHGDHLATTPTPSLADFGRWELRPFLELAIRFFLMPLDSVTFSDLTYIHLPPPDGPGGSVHEDKKIKKKGTKKKEEKSTLHFADDGSLILSYSVESRGGSRDGKDVRRVHLPVPTGLGLYIHFYLACCRPHQVWDLSYDGRLFPIAYRSVQESLAYVARFRDEDPCLERLLESDMTSRKYVHWSKVLFSCIQTYLHGKDLLDDETLSFHLTRCGVSMAVFQANKYYKGLEHLRANRDAVAYLDEGMPQAGAEAILGFRGPPEDLRKVLQAEVDLFLRFRRDPDRPGARPRRNKKRPSKLR